MEQAKTETIMPKHYNIGDFTDKELESELLRRKNAKMNKGWKFIVNLDESNRVGAARFDLMKGKQLIFDDPVSSRINLPPKFAEPIEGVVEFDGSIAKARKLLTEYGFTEVVGKMG